MSTAITPADARAIDLDEINLQTKFKILPGTSTKDLVYDVERLLCAVATIADDATTEPNSVERTDDRLFVVSLLTRLATGMVSEAGLTLAKFEAAADRILAEDEQGEAP